ncbi:MAG: hypothetical protein IPM99_07520 [Rubrivivax sp.]|nr:hypothetical protein [Rubrivivax sp.]
MNPRRQLLATTGAALAAAAAGSAQARPGMADADTLYGHGMVWNRELPGLAGRLNLAFDLRINLATGTGAGSAGDPAHLGEGFQFAIERARGASACATRTACWKAASPTPSTRADRRAGAHRGADPGRHRRS